MREWLSGRALPCQGRYRGSESRLPLQTWHHRQVVRLGSAKPLSPVRIWVVPPKMPKWRNGRRKGFKIPRGQPCAGSSPAFGTKKVVSKGYDFFYPNRRFGISSRHSRAYPFLRFDEIQHCVLMICNSFGIDDIQGYHLDSNVRMWYNTLKEVMLS